MKNIVFALLIGICAGTIDILPMIKMKMDRYSILSAFLFYFIAPFIILSSNLFGMPWWLKGAVITLAIALSNLVIIAKTEKNAVPGIIIMAIFMGTLIGIAGHLLNISL